VRLNATKSLAIERGLQRVVGQTTRSKGLWYSAPLAVIRWQSIPSKTRTFSNRYACSAGGTSCSTDALRPCARVTFKSDFTGTHDHCCCCNRGSSSHAQSLGLPVKSPARGEAVPFGTLQHALILLKANGSTAMLQYDLSQGEEHPPNEALQPDKVSPQHTGIEGSAGLIPRQTPIEHGAASAQTNRST